MSSPLLLRVGEQRSESVSHMRIGIGIGIGIA
jgi:hypothetical protein